MASESGEKASASMLSVYWTTKREALTTDSKMASPSDAKASCALCISGHRHQRLLLLLPSRDAVGEELVVCQSALQRAGDAVLYVAGGHQGLELVGVGQEVRDRASDGEHPLGGVQPLRAHLCRNVLQPHEVDGAQALDDVCSACADDGNCNLATCNVGDEQALREDGGRLRPSNTLRHTGRSKCEAASGRRQSG